MRVNPLVPWIGGKSRLAKRIIPLFPEHTCYVEAFAGGAALFFRKAQAEVEVLNDINGDLVNLYRVVQHHLDEFINQFKWSLISRQMYGWLNTTRPETLTDIQRAARFYYLQRQGFGGKVEGRTFGTATTSPPKLDLTRIGESLSLAHLRLARTTIEHLPWADCIRRYDRPHTLIYCDPPYYGTEGYGVGFGLEQYDLLAEMARTIQGHMIISVNDIPEMRRAFDGLSIATAEICYTVGGSGRAGKSGELIVANFPIQ